VQRNVVKTVEKDFSGWNDFQNHISFSGKCAGLIELATTEAIYVIQKLT
jgi:hypothetical protein